MHPLPSRVEAASFSGTASRPRPPSMWPPSRFRLPYRCRQAACCFWQRWVALRPCGVARRPHARRKPYNMLTGHDVACQRYRYDGRGLDRCRSMIQPVSYGTGPQPMNDDDACQDRRGGGHGLPLRRPCRRQVFSCTSEFAFAPMRALRNSLCNRRCGTGVPPLWRLPPRVRRDPWGECP